MPMSRNVLWKKTFLNWYKMVEPRGQPTCAWSTHPSANPRTTLIALAYQFYIYWPKAHAIMALLCSFNNWDSFIIPTLWFQDVITYQEVVDSCSLKKHHLRIGTLVRTTLKGRKGVVYSQPESMQHQLLKATSKIFHNSYLLFKNNVPASTKLLRNPKETLVKVSFDSNPSATSLSLDSLSSVTHWGLLGVCGSLIWFRRLSTLEMSA